MRLRHQHHIAAGTRRLRQPLNGDHRLGAGRELVGNKADAPPPRSRSNRYRHRRHRITQPPRSLEHPLLGFSRELYPRRMIQNERHSRLRTPRLASHVGHGNPAAAIALCAHRLRRDCIG
jgi:hypothetical protein